MRSARFANNIKDVPPPLQSIHLQSSAFRTQPWHLLPSWTRRLPLPDCALSVRFASSVKFPDALQASCAPQTPTRPKEEKSAHHERISRLKFIKREHTEWEVNVWRTLFQKKRQKWCLNTKPESEGGPSCEDGSLLRGSEPSRCSEGGTSRG